MPDLRFTLGAVLATALLAVTALGVAATLRLAQHARLGPLQNSGSLAYSDASDWNQFIDPTAARRFDELMRPIEGVSMPVSETAIAEVPGQAGTPPAIAMSSQPAADPLPSIAPGADRSQGAVAAAPQEQVLATLPAQSPEVAASAALPVLQHELPPDPMATASIDVPTLPQPATTAAPETSATAPAAIERTTAVANVAVTEQPQTPGPLATPADPSVVTTPPTFALAEETGRAESADVQAPPIVLVSPTPSDPVPAVPTPIAPAATSTLRTTPVLIEPPPVVPTTPVAPHPAAGVERVASLPTALRAVQVTTAPFPPLPRAAPHRRFAKAASQAHNAARRYSIVRRAPASRTAQIQRAQPAPSPFGTMNFTAATAQPPNLFGPATNVTATATKANHKRTEIKDSATYSNDPVNRNVAPNTFGR